MKDQGQWLPVYLTVIVEIFVVFRMSVEVVDATTNVLLRSNETTAFPLSEVAFMVTVATVTAPLTGGAPPAVPTASAAVFEVQLLAANVAHTAAGVIVEQSSRVSGNARKNCTALTGWPPVLMETVSVTVPF
ncbi:hypothetical protein ACVBEQ_21720 [Nakamurella sp. GG22]